MSLLLTIGVFVFAIYFLINAIEYKGNMPMFFLNLLLCVWAFACFFYRIGVI